MAKTRREKNVKAKAARALNRASPVAVVRGPTPGTKEFKKRQKHKELIDKLKKQADVEKVDEVTSMKSLSESLAEESKKFIKKSNDVSAHKTTKKTRHRQKNVLQEDEIRNLKLVYAHNSFKASPGNALAEHLRNTLVALPAAPAAIHRKR